MRKLLLLLGAARYPWRSDLPLPAFRVAHAAFKAAMTEGRPPIVAPNDCLDLFDDDGAWVEQQARIAKWLDEKRREPGRPEALLLYYVGHGGIERGEQVYLTINSTNKIDPYFSSVPRDSLARLLRFSAGDYRKFLILDCCFAASIIKSLLSPIQDKMTVELNEVGKVVSKPDGGGLAALCASSSLAAANADGRDGLTQFTDGLLSVLRIGDRNHPGDLSFERVRALLEQQLHERYGPEAVAPSSYFSDDVHEPVHRLPLFPNPARPAGIVTPRTDAPVERHPGLGPGAADLQLFGNLRDIEKKVASAFRKHQQQALSPSALQALARPIERHAVRLTHLGIVEELLGRDGDPVERDAAIFTAAVIIYKRQERQFLPPLLDLASEGHPVRGAVMWRVLRAIKRLAPQGPLDTGLHAALRKALTNCARAYDSPAGLRFQGRDIVLLIAQTAALSRLKLDLEEIFSAEQIAEWKSVGGGRPEQRAAGSAGPISSRSAAARKTGADDMAAIEAAAGLGRAVSADLLRRDADVEQVAQLALSLRAGRMLERMIATLLVRQHRDPRAVFESVAGLATTRDEFKSIAPFLRIVRDGRSVDLITRLFSERVSPNEADSIRMRACFLGWSGENLFPMVDWSDKWCQEKLSFYYARSYLHAGWSDQSDHELRSLVSASIDANGYYASYYNYEISFLDWLSSLKGVPAANSRVMLQAMLTHKAPPAMIAALLARIAVDPATAAAADLRSLSSHENSEVCSAAMVALAFIPARSEGLRAMKRSTFARQSAPFAIMAGTDMMEEAVGDVGALLNGEPTGTANYHAGWALGRLAAKSAEARELLARGALENPDKLVRSICIAALAPHDPERAGALVEAEAADARDLEQFCLCIARTYFEDIRPLFRLMQGTGEDRIYVPYMLPGFQAMFRDAVAHASDQAPFLKSLVARPDDN